MYNILRSAALFSGVAICLVLLLPGAQRFDTPAFYRSPVELTYSPDGSKLAVSDHTANLLYVVDRNTGRIEAEVPVNGKPEGVVWKNDRTVLLAEYDSGTLAEIDAGSGTIQRRIHVGARPISVALAHNTAVVSSYGGRDVAVVDLSKGAVVRRIPTGGHAFSVAVTPDGRTAVVGNLLPSIASTDPSSASELSIIDLEQYRLLRRIRLKYGSSNLRGIVVSPDGRFVYAVHTLGHVKLPTSQIERGWVNTNAVTIIDLNSSKQTATFLLDLPEEGAADPWDVGISPDGRQLWVTLAGTHQVAGIDLQKLQTCLWSDDETFLSDEIRDENLRLRWRGYRQPGGVSSFSSDLGLLRESGILTRYDVPVDGPRGLDITPDGGHLAIAGYFSGTVIELDTHHPSSMRRFALGNTPKPDAVRRGAMVFHDGKRTFQHWLSCATCHPDGRSDALNWDLLNDGIGNPKNTKSLVLSPETPPSMAHGVRASYEVAVTAGFKYIQFHEATVAEQEDVKAYLKSLKPEPGPVPAGSEASTEVEAGRRLFFDPVIGCSSCHSGPLYTNLGMHDVGTGFELDRDKRFDTPNLLELWRTGPYLHSGQAPTLRSVLTFHNPGDHHGRTSHLSSTEIGALVAFLESL